MTENKWKWYAGSNDEHYAIGPCETRDDAIQQGRVDFGDDVGFYIIEAQKVHIRLADYIGADNVLEEAEERAYDLTNEDGDPIFDVTEDQYKDLSSRLRTACDEWQKAHAINFIPWAFTSTGNAEFIEPEVQ